MMTETLRVLLIIAIIIYFFIVFRLLKKGDLALKYSLLWLLMGIVMAILLCFPKLLDMLCHLFGIADAMNGFFTFAIAFIIILLMALTSIVSKQSDKIKNLTQENALLEKKIRDINDKQ